MAKALRDAIPHSPLSTNQKSLMIDFYACDLTRVVLNKNERQKIWKNFKSNREIPPIGLETSCPALLMELQKAILNKKNVQSAVFSECAYAQTLANMLGLTEFQTSVFEPLVLPAKAIGALEKHKLTPRYIYSNKSGNRVLVQAGGPGGIDSLYMDLSRDRFITIEFKEAASKTSEPDLPEYDESGFIKKSQEFVLKHPQFEMMLDEQIDKKLNFFEKKGSNVKDFTKESVVRAITENYSSNKFADVICVEDRQGLLAMVPANHAAMWSLNKGEIRPAGRNHYPVFTPVALKAFLQDAGGTVDGNQVQFPIEKLRTSKPRGGNEDVNRYKINSLFFIYSVSVLVESNIAYFNLQEVQQLRPTISAHMFFKELNVDVILKHYERDLIE